MIVDVLNQLSDSDTRDEGERRAHAALFAHVGVTDPADWQTVALRLACMYKPDLLMGLNSCEPAAPAAGGRPKKWTEWQLMMADILVEKVKKESRQGTIRTGLSKNIDACKYIVNERYEETAGIRKLLQLQPETDAKTLDNMRRKGAKLRVGASPFGGNSYRLDAANEKVG